VVYPANCSVDDSLCASTQQANTLTAISITDDANYACGPPSANCSECRAAGDPGACPDCSCFLGCTNASAWLTSYTCDGDACLPLEKNLFVNYRVTESGGMADLTFPTVLSHGGFFQNASVISIKSVQPECKCNGSAILNACLTFTVPLTETPHPAPITLHPTS